MKIYHFYYIIKEEVINLKTVRCLKCGALYPTDMNKCPTCNCENNEVNSKKIEEAKKSPNSQGYWGNSTVKHTTQTPKITCPYCQSTNTQKISGLSKAGSVALWGIFALGRTTKQWHCNNCKSDF